MRWRLRRLLRHLSRLLLMWLWPLPLRMWLPPLLLLLLLLL